MKRGSKVAFPHATMSISLMPSLDPCLAGCDHALAEADRLIASLAGFPVSLEPELAATRIRIAVLRREVERLRGMTTLPPRRKIHPDRIDLSNSASPWGARQAEEKTGH